MTSERPFSLSYESSEPLLDHRDAPSPLESDAQLDLHMSDLPSSAEAIARNLASSAHSGLSGYERPRTKTQEDNEAVATFGAYVLVLRNRDLNQGQFDLAA